MHFIHTPVINSDYRGPVDMIAMNAGAAAFTIEHGMRIAKLVLAPVIQAQYALSDAWTETDRGAGGCGSTGAD